MVIKTLQTLVVDDEPVARQILTAYSEHAIQAFEIGAIDYLLKPIAEKRLQTAPERAREARRRPLEVAERFATALHAVGPEPSIGPSKIVVHHGQDYYLLNLEEVFAFQADGEIVWAHAEKRKYRATQNLRTLEQRLSDSPFQRAHRSVLLNTDKIRRMSSLGSGRWLLTLTNGLEFTVSRRPAPMIDAVLRCGK